MNLVYSIFILTQVVIGINLFLPFITYIIYCTRRNSLPSILTYPERDFAVIITAYEQTSMLNNVVKSILDSDYNNYVIYVVADNCDVSNLTFESDRVKLLRPDVVLASNVKSHFYAIKRFIRAHEYLTIIDSDNLVERNFLKELNKVFSNGFEAVQGQRRAKNLDTRFACLDEAGDMYYRFIDRKLLFSAGSSASLAGSGMGFKTSLYSECLEYSNIEGAGFDKVLQLELLNRGRRIAFAEDAIVYDEKTSKSEQLVHQRSRWINTWFKYAGGGIKLMFIGLTHLNWNQFLIGLAFARPPLFMLVFLVMISMILNLIFLPSMNVFWGMTLLSFFFVFFAALQYFKAKRPIYMALLNVPIFIFYQIISLLKFKEANKTSVSTVHYHDKGLDKDV